MTYKAMHSTKIVTFEMLNEAEARAKENGDNLRGYTAHKIAHDLMAFEKDFEDADYTQLVTKVTLWLRGVR